MANNVSSVVNAMASPAVTSSQSGATRSALQRPTSDASHLTAAPDRVALSDNRLTATLVLGVATAAALVPGVAEAEAASGAVTAIGIGVRALAANKAVTIATSFAAGAAGGYVRSLVHDATAGQPVLGGIADVGKALDASIHSLLGIPQSDPSR